MNAGATAAAAPWPSVPSHLPQCRVHSPSPARIPRRADRFACTEPLTAPQIHVRAAPSPIDRSGSVVSPAGGDPRRAGFTPSTLRPAPVLWPAIPPGSPCGSSAQASAGIASRGSARRCRLIGTGRGMLLAAAAPPSRDGCTVLFPAAQPTSNSMTRRCVSLASIIGPRAAAIRRAAGGPGTLVLASWSAAAAVRCASPRCPPGRGGTQRPATQTVPPVGQARRLARRPRPLCDYGTSPIYWNLMRVEPPERRLRSTSRSSRRYRTGWSWTSSTEPAGRTTATFDRACGAE
jgi:hypothetical protein